jgi:hypothetical protein
MRNKKWAALILFSYKKRPFLATRNLLGTRVPE